MKFQIKPYNEINLIIHSMFVIILSHLLPLVFCAGIVRVCVKIF